VAATVVLAAALAKAGSPAEPWGLAFHPQSVHPAMAILEDYCRRGRGNELILVQPDDGFYSAVLPLPRVRYCLLDPTGGPRQGPLDLRYMGILIDATQFVHMDRWRPVFQQRLKAWGLHSGT